MSGVEEVGVEYVTTPGELGRFIEAFPVLAGAPGGVGKIRNLILQLAINGALVNHSDELAKDLIDNLKNHQSKLENAGKIKYNKKHKALGNADGYFELPAHWEWIYLAHVPISPLVDGDWVESKDQDPNGEVRLTQLADVGVGRFKDKSARFLTREKAEELNCSYLIEGDILIARLPDPIGRACIFPGNDQDCVTVVDVAICRIDKTYFDPDYIVAAINSPLVQAKMMEMATGITRQRVATGNMGGIQIPIPPLEEQKRIVAKVDELMALCDQLESQQQQQANTVLRANTAAINALLNSGSQSAKVSESNSFENNWHRIAKHFNTLYGCTLPMPPGEGRQKKYLVGLENIKALRQVILQMAVSGHLSSRDDEFIKADTLVDKLMDENKSLASELGLKYKPVSYDKMVKSKFPVEWSVIPFVNLGVMLGGGTPSKQKLEFWKGNIPWVTPKDMKVPYINDSIDKISQDAIDHSSAKLIPENSLLFVVRGMILQHSFPVALNNRAVTVNQDMKGLVFGKSIMKDFVLLLAQALKQDVLRCVERPTHGTCKLPVDNLAEVLVGIPPPEEQKHIVKKVDELMALCDKLEQQLTQSYSDAEKLMEATVKALVA